MRWPGQARPGQPPPTPPTSSPPLVRSRSPLAAHRGPARPACTHTAGARGQARLARAGPQRACKVVLHTRLPRRPGTLLPAPPRPPLHHISDLLQWDPAPAPRPPSPRVPGTPQSCRKQTRPGWRPGKWPGGPERRGPRGGRRRRSGARGRSPASGEGGGWKGGWGWGGGEAGAAGR